MAALGMVILVVRGLSPDLSILRAARARRLRSCDCPLTQMTLNGHRIAALFVGSDRLQSEAQGGA
jgi:hypothetical protein